ncbi:MAG TPA: ATP-binding protein [Paraburkholderia sp.]|jgi:signal transduction histidine kinase|nr:ATP-binding protein [Paraburkholderia sp.]
MDTSIVVPFTPPTSPSTARDDTHTGSSELARLRARVRELSAELIEAQEAARCHMARELHDGMGAELTATRFALAGVETWLPADAPPQCAAALAMTNRSLDAVFNASRQIISDLHGPSLDAGLVRALAQWIDDFSARTQLRASFASTGDARLARLPAGSALAIFRVAQEALNNVAKHARAASASVRIEAGRHHLMLSVSDDGIGMTRATRARPGHFGLSGMRARCEAFDGTLRVGWRRTAADYGQPADDERGTVVVARFAWDALLGIAPAIASRRALQS